MCMLLGFESMHLPPNVALFALEDNQSSAKALEPTALARAPGSARSRAHGQIGLRSRMEIGAARRPSPKTDEDRGRAKAEALV